jgi:hypothetical protein
VFAVNARPIEKLVAAHKERLDAAGRAPFHKFRDITLVADRHIHGDPRVSQVESRVFADLAIVRHRDANLMFARPQLTRQRFEHIHEHRRPRERRPLRADH